MKGNIHSPSPGISEMFARLKDEMCRSMPSLLSKEKLHEKLTGFRSAVQKAINDRNTEVITVMGMRIEQFTQKQLPEESREARSQTQSAQLIFNTRRVVYEALVDEWNNNIWIYSKAELVRRAILLLSTEERKEKILAEFTSVSPGGRVQQPGAAEFSLFLKEAIAYLEHELDGDSY
jgi:hypothetical protein